MSTNTVFIGSIAENYEKYLGAALFEPYAKDLAGRLAAGKINSILEVACGTAQVTRLLGKQLPGARIAATDLNPGMLELAKKIIGPEVKIEWSVANAEELPYDDSTFDAVICQFGLMFVPDKQKAVNEAHRVLKPGGRFIFNTWDSLETNPVSKIANEVIISIFKGKSFDFFNVPYSMYDPGEMELLLQTAGFKNVSVEKVEYTGYSVSALDAAKGLTEGTPAYLAICENDEKLLPEIQESVAAKIEKKFGAASIDVPLAAWVSVGVK